MGTEDWELMLGSWCGFGDANACGLRVTHVFVIVIHFNGLYYKLLDRLM